MPPSIPHFLTEAETAELLRLTPAALRKRRQRKQRPEFVSLDGSVRYPLIPLLHYLSERSRRHAAH